MKKLFAMVALAFTVFSCGFGSSEKQQEKLTFYAGLQEDHAAMIAERFQKETGIQTEFVRLSSGETLARLKAERDNMTASVWYGGPVDGIVAANEEGLIEAYISPEAKNIKEEFKEPNGVWTGIYVGYLGFVGNEKVLKCLNHGLTY